ncbi:unnamed protein product [Mytilus edulis]|uniref:SET domain-containing protein n=1 Tax=Mytilus edulis TaxID=6550 RepID=A0A8S3SQQ9_MYTED|nr:unnamed protein product [Mytilus edulis]
MKPDIPSKCELDSQLRTSTEWCLRQIVLKRHEYKHVCPHLSNIAEIVLTVPVSNAWPERGCSKVKIIKTDLRNRLKNDVLNGLMMISINGPQTCSHECDKVVNDSVKLWLGEKNRRKLPSKNKGQVEMEMNKPSAHATPIDNVQIQLPTVHNEKPDNNSESEPDPNAYDDPELNEREIEKTLLQLKIVRSLIEAKTLKLLEEIKLLDENIAKNRSYETTEGNKEVQPELFHDRDTVLTQASSAVTMKYDKDRGRYLQATCKIPAGSVIIAEKPFATVLLPDHYQTHCHHCIGQLTAVVPDKMSASEFYQKEDRIGGVTEEGTYDKTYLSVYDLMTHALDIETADSFQYTLTALLLLTILKKSGWLEKKSGDVKITNDNTEDITKLQFSQDDLYIGGLLLRHIEQLVCNAHAITELQVTQTSDTSLVDSKSQERVATAIYPTTSLLNHSCDPSIIPGFDKDKLVVRVIKDVEAGEEIFNCYGPHHKRMSKMERQQALKTQYFFTCQCPSCQAYDEQDIFTSYCCPLCKAALKENETTCSCTACDFTDHVTMFLTNENTAKNMFIDGLKCLQIQDIEGLWCYFSQTVKCTVKGFCKHHKSLETKVLAQCYALSKKYNKAIPYLRDSVCTLGKLYGDTSIEYANELHKFAGVLYYAEGFLEEGLAVIDKAVQIFTLHCGNKYELVQELEEMKICMLDKLKIE